MAKRSGFKRRKHDAYQTIDPRAVAALRPHIGRVQTFAEPCAGDMHLVLALTALGLRCPLSYDISWTPSVDAMTMDLSGVDAIITNPPWTRQLLHPMILHFQKQAPTWLLFDSDWAYNKTSVPYLAHCSDIVAIGRLCWIEGTKQTGKDNCSWYRFSLDHAGPTRFHNRRGL